MDAPLLIPVLCAALLFAGTNGAHDASNVVAVPIETKAATPAVALVLAAVLNGAGALFGTEIALTFGRDLLTNLAPGIDPQHARTVVLGALVGALVWNLFTWWRGLPTSSTHALIGALVGGGIAAGGGVVAWGAVASAVLVPSALGIIVALVGSRLLLAVGRRVLRSAPTDPTSQSLRLAQVVSSSAVAVGHGIQSAQKITGLLLIALPSVAAASAGSTVWPLRIGVASALAAGTLAGGRPIIRTLARGITRLSPLNGLSSQLAAAGPSYLGAFLFALPVSTTHAVVASLVGAGLGNGRGAVNWRCLGLIVLAWIATLPAAALVAAVTVRGVQLVL